MKNEINYFEYDDDFVIKIPNKLFEQTEDIDPSVLITTFIFIKLNSTKLDTCTFTRKGIINFMNFKRVRKDTKVYENMINSLSYLEKEGYIKLHSDIESTNLLMNLISDKTYPLNSYSTINYQEIVKVKKISEECKVDFAKLLLVFSYTRSFIYEKNKVKYCFFKSIETTANVLSLSPTTVASYMKYLSDGKYKLIKCFKTYKESKHSETDMPSINIYTLYYGEEYDYLNDLSYAISKIALFYKTNPEKIKIKSTND